MQKITVNKFALKFYKFWNVFREKYSDKLI
jgi:hypothetical protein